MPAKQRARPHTPLDRDYLAQDTIRELGLRFKAAGPLVFLAIILEAGKATGTTEPGVFEMRYRSIAQLAFTDAETVRAVVLAAEDAGLVVDLACNREIFSGRLTKWDKWEVATEAQRSADHRARQRAAA